MVGFSIEPPILKVIVQEMLRDLHPEDGGSHFMK